VNTTANWWDGANATPWYDFGAPDYSAQFAGTAGTVNLAANVNVNRLSFDTTGYTIQGNTINLNGSQPIVSVASGATATVASAISGWNGLKKEGAGTLKITAANSYSGGTTVNQGTLLLDGGTGGYARIKDALTVNSGASVNFANDDGTGLGWTTGSKVTSLDINGGSVVSGGIMHVWDLAGGVTMTGGTLASNGGVSNPSGGFLEWHGTSVTTLASANTATIGGRIRIRSDGGYSGIDFTVADGAAATDLLVSAAITEAGGAVGITKNGSGTMVLSGNNSYAGATTVNQGVLSVTGSVPSTSSVTIAAGAELRISGTLQTSGNVTNSGTLVFSGSAVFSAAGTITNYGTIINSSPSLVLPGNIVNYGTILTLPSAPTGLTATPSGTSAVLAWSALSGATSYQVKQGTSASGPFTVIGSPATNSFTTASLTSGTTYYFVVSAVNSVGEGANSASASCVIGGLPLPWVTADIGSVGIAGSASATSGVYTVNGSGTGVYASSDQFRMVYQNSSGDCQLIARVNSLTAPSTSAKTGVMIRESLAANARCAGVYVTPSSGVQFIWRTSTGSMVSIATATGITAPRWVRIQRVGNSFRAFHSANGSTWTQFGGNKTISMATSAYLGQAVTSGTNSALSTGVFSSVTATP
jgi:autotransporter-associated beta strand protein